MFSFFGFNNYKIKKALAENAIIIDVRTPVEFDKGKVPNSINIPLDRLQLNIERIKLMKQPIIVCCATGVRSGMAKNMLKSAGVATIINGGSWQKILNLYNEL